MITFEVADLLLWAIPVIVSFGWAVIHHMRKDDEQHKEILNTVREIKDVLEKGKT